MKKFSLVTLGVATSLSSSLVSADAVTDWNFYTALATKGANSTTTGTASNALNSNVSTRIAAIEGRAVFDAVNAILHISPKNYDYHPDNTPTGLTAKSADAAAAQAAHDVLLGLLSSANTGTRGWLDTQLQTDLTALGVSASDPGITIGKAAAAAALAARANDFAQIRTTYTPSSNLAVSSDGKSVVANARGNPGIGLWRPSNGAAGDIDPVTGAPTGFVGATIQAAAAIDFNWKNVTPFSLSTVEKQLLVAKVPPSLKISGNVDSEYQKELAFVESHGQDSAHQGQRSGDQTLQALYYKADAELFVNEAARVASQARHLTLSQNAKLFAALDNALADARIAAWQSKYDLLFWRPITAINADIATGVVASYDWKPLAATPSHPSSTAGHSTTVAAGAEILRAFFKSDQIDPNGNAVTLTIPTWIIGTNNGTGKANPLINGKDGTTREVSSFTQIQLENGQSRLYLGVHFGTDNYQGQVLGLSVADTILAEKNDPAVKGVKPYGGGKSVANLRNLRELLLDDSANSGYFGD